MNTLARVAAVLLVVFWTRTAQAAEESVRVALTTAPLADPNMVLSASSFDQRKPERPIVYYSAYGSEVLLPNRRMVFTPQSPRQVLTIGGMACTIQQGPAGFRLAISGKDADLRLSGLGCAPAPLALAADPHYVLAFPRAFFFGDTATLYCRAGAVKTGTVGKCPILLYDENLDGCYRKRTAGLCVGDPGKIGIFAPVADLLPTPEAVYRIERIAADGSALTLAPYAGPTGRLKVESAAEDVECRLALTSDDGQCSFGMLAEEQAMLLPAGTYRVPYGLLYRSLAKHAAAVVLPGKGLPIHVRANEEVKLVLGESLQEPLQASEQVLTTTFDALLEINLAGVAEACDRGEFDQAHKLFAQITGKYKSGPNVEASRQWLESVGQRVQFEASPEAVAFRQAQARVLLAVKQGDLAAARQALPAAHRTFVAIPARFAGYPAYHTCKAQADALERYCAGRVPGLRATYWEWRFSKQCGAEVVGQIDWQGGRAGKTQFFGCRYKGFLVVPEDGEYELSLASAQAAKLSLDAEQLIDHEKAHNLAERAVKVTLRAGPHPLEIEMWNALGRGELHFRWTPPGGRKALVPAWALECRPGGS
jgi:hypothetical protein